MKAKDIRNGCLYYNNITKRVERAIGRIGRRVMTMVHDTDPGIVKVDNIRKARPVEVRNYLHPVAAKVSRAVKRVTGLVQRRKTAKAKA